MDVRNRVQALLAHSSLVKVTAILFFLSHIILIPFMAVYGVRICPVLHEAGFGFGCKYNSVFVFGILGANAILNTIVWKWILPHVRDPLALQFAPFLSIFSYLGTFLLGAALLNSYLHELHVDGSVLSRLDDVFSYGAILLSMLQKQLGDWALYDQILKARDSWRMPDINHPIGRYFHKWLEKLSESNPILAGSLICGSIFHRSLHMLPESFGKIDVWTAMIVRECYHGIILFLIWVAIAQFFQMVRKKKMSLNNSSMEEPLG